MTNESVCPRCHEPIPAGETECPQCAIYGPPLQLRRDWLLTTVVVVIAFGLFLIAYSVTDFYNRREQKLARDWYGRGDSALSSARFDEAVADLRTALVYSHESFAVRLRLAEALAAAGHQSQAQAYLKALWEEQPGNATVNLELARIAVPAGDVSGALRYYHGAIFGVWERDPFEQRRIARLELIDFLLQRHALQEAEAELIAVTADLPRDPNQLVRIAGDFLQTGDTRRALEEFTVAARIDPQNAAAYRGAAQAARREQQFAEAKRYAEKALKLDAGDSAAAATLRTIDLALEMNPMRRGLSVGQRISRAARALEQAQYRLESCGARQGVTLSQAVGQQSREATLATDYAEVLSLKPRLRPEVLRREPDLLRTVMDVVFRSESDAEQHCGPASGADEVLQLIGRRQGVIP